ncbi:unnamed protein product [Adineta steineri]|uniref:Uncharacterized protein n=2 Tax=Adineta steineri TaxID=433720 RepID=A0A814J8H8_9BILA|nr:unnamed protein product [Adineta steineri]
MVGICLIYLLILPIVMVGAIKEIVVEKPFYLRARVQDSQTASVLFEIEDTNNQRSCLMYKFTIRHNREYPYSMPEQNLAFWRNSLELKHLDAGDYRICAIICSEFLKKKSNFTSEKFISKNRSIPITACITIHAYRSHFLILTLYILVAIILVFSQFIFTLRKRKIKARIKSALAEVETTLHNWRNTQTSSPSIDHTQSYSILQSLVTLPASPIDYSKNSLTPSTTEQRRPTHPVIFHIENSVTEIP